MNDKDRLASALRHLQQAAVHVDTVRRAPQSDYATSTTLWRVGQRIHAAQSLLRNAAHDAARLRARGDKGERRC